jgi:hypothetical protein
MSTYETTVIPAMGRDYKSGAAALLDWDAGKDFRIDNMFHASDGRLVNNQAGMDVMIRFCQNRKTVMAKGVKG